jgi:hypothetical protein
MTTRLSLVLSSAFSSAAILESSKVLSSFNASSSYNIPTVLEPLKEKLRRSAKSPDSVCITTDAVRHAIEADNDKLQRVSLYRFSSPEGPDSPTLLDDSIAKKVLSLHVLNGAHGFDGRLLSSIKATEIEESFKRDYRNGEKACVVSSPFSILYEDQESAGERKLKSLGAKRIWATREISNIPSIMDRETTAILSAATSHIIEGMEENVKDALSNLGIRKLAIYFGRNDGSIIGSSLAKQYPLETAWGVQGQSIAGISKSLRLSKCVAFGKLDHDRAWLGASNNYRPLMRQIAYLKNMLIHVKIPLLAEFDAVLSDEIKKEKFETISEIAGTKGVFLATPLDIGDHLRYPFVVRRNKMSETSTATNCATAEISWERSICMNEKSDQKKAEIAVRNQLQKQMLAAGAKKGSIKLSKVEIKPGYNLPEGTLTLSVHATGKI